MMHPSSCRCSAAKLHINCRASSSRSAFQVGTTWGGLDSPGTGKFSGQSMKMTSTPALAFGTPSNRQVFPPENCAWVVYEEINYKHKHDANDRECNRQTNYTISIDEYCEPRNWGMCTQNSIFEYFLSYFGVPS